MTFQLEGGYIPNSRGLEEKRTIPNCMLHTGVGGRGWKEYFLSQKCEYLGYLGFQNTLKVYWKLCSFQTMIKLFHATSLALQDNQCQLYTTKITHLWSISKSYFIFFIINQLLNRQIAYYSTNNLSQTWKM